MPITPYQQILWKVLTHPLNQERRIARIKLLRESAQIGLKYAKDLVEDFETFKTIEQFVAAINRLNIDKEWLEVKEYEPFVLDYSFEQARKDLLVEKLKSV
jgi:UDP-3-O-acyl-N-acetylglucosamine deacetylase